MPVAIDPKTFMKLAKLAVTKAKAEVKRRRDAAGYGGEMHDRGAGELDAKVDIWFGTLTSPERVPEFMMTFWDEARQELRLEEMRRDPEWSEYERLKAKFGGL